MVPKKQLLNAVLFFSRKKDLIREDHSRVTSWAIAERLLYIMVQLVLLNKNKKIPKHHFCDD